MENDINLSGSEKDLINMNTSESINSVPAPIHGETESSALLGLFFYSILMFTVPFGGYMATKHYLEQNLLLDKIYNLVIPIIVAVMLVNLIIVMYVFRAFREDKNDNVLSNRPIEERKKLE